MYIVLAMIAAGAVGAIIHVLTPNRDRRGVILSGAVSVVLAAVVYAAMTWAGFAQNNPWLWVASIGGPLIVTWVFTVALTRARVASDTRAKAAAGLL